VPVPAGGWPRCCRGVCPCLPGEGLGWAGLVPLWAPGPRVRLKADRGRRVWCSWEDADRGKPVAVRALDHLSPFPITRARNVGPGSVHGLPSAGRPERNNQVPPGLNLRGREGTLGLGGPTGGLRGWARRLVDPRGPR